MDFDEEIESRKGVSDVPRPCRNCGHDYHIFRTPINYPWSGDLVDEVCECGCRNYEPIEAEDILDREGRI